MTYTCGISGGLATILLLAVRPGVRDCIRRAGAEKLGSPGCLWQPRTSKACAGQGQARQGSCILTRMVAEGTDLSRVAKRLQEYKSPTTPSQGCLPSRLAALRDEVTSPLEQKYATVYNGGSGFWVWGTSSGTQSYCVCLATSSVCYLQGRKTLLVSVPAWVYTTSTPQHPHSRNRLADQPPY